MDILIDNLQRVWFLYVILVALAALVALIIGASLFLSLTGRKIAIVRKAICSYESELKKSVVLNIRKPSAALRNQWIGNGTRHRRGEPAR